MPASWTTKPTGRSHRREIRNDFANLDSTLVSRLHTPARDRGEVSTFSSNLSDESVHLARWRCLLSHCKLTTAERIGVLLCCSGPSSSPLSSPSPRSCPLPPR